MLSLTLVDNPADVADTHMVHRVLLQKMQQHSTSHNGLRTFVVPGVLEKVLS